MPAPSNYITRYISRPLVPPPPIARARRAGCAASPYPRAAVTMGSVSISIIFRVIIPTGCHAGANLSSPDRSHNRSHRNLPSLSQSEPLSSTRPNQTTTRLPFLYIDFTYQPYQRSSPNAKLHLKLSLPYPTLVTNSSLTNTHSLSHCPLPNSIQKPKSHINNGCVCLLHLSFVGSG